MAPFPPMSVAPLVLAALLTGCKLVVSPPIPVGRSVLPPLPCNRIFGCASQQPSGSWDRWHGRLVELDVLAFYLDMPLRTTVVCLPPVDLTLPWCVCYLDCLEVTLQRGFPPVLDALGFTMDFQTALGPAPGIRPLSIPCSNLDFNLRGLSGHRTSKISPVNLAVTSSTRRQAATPMVKALWSSRLLRTSRRLLRPLMAASSRIFA